MTKSSSTQSLQPEITRSVERAQAIERELAARHGPPRPGDLFLLPEAIDILVNWALLRQDEQDPQKLYAVPADDHPLAGSHDMKLPETSLCAPLTLRLGLGQWFHEVDFDPALRCGVLEEEFIQQALARIDEMIKGAYTPTADERAIDADPEYQAWLRQIEMIWDLAIERCKGRGHVVSLVSFQREETASPGRRVTEQPVAMAAAPGGLLGDVAETLAKALGKEGLFHLLSAFKPGKLYLRADAEGIRGVWTGRSGTPPPLRGTTAEGKLKAARWRRSPDGKSFETITFPWRHGRVVLRIGTGEGKQVTVLAE
jgi:hypothetical protein